MAVRERALAAPVVDPMHVLITVNAAWNIWNFRRSLVAALIKAGHRVTVLAPADESMEKLAALGCHVLPLEMDVKGLNPAADLGLTLRLRRLIRQERPDVILSYTIKNNIFGALAARGLGTPFLPTVTGLGTAFLSGGALQRVAEILYRLAFRRLPFVFFQNGDDSGLFLARGLVRAGQVRHLPGSGIDLARFAPAPMPDPDGGAPVFLMIARLLRDKGVREFVDAARLIHAAGIPARFQLVGAAGADNRSAISLPEVEGWVAEGLVEYPGPQADVRPFIRAATCVVLPSYREGAPRTLIEASAMARPVIATDVPGCRAVVKEGETGFLCQPRDARSLAETIERFLSLPPETQARMGQAARSLMERDYDEAFVIDAYLSAIRAVALRR
jgi:glycosyltransferase involved in cell wall biosynthesis